jgi:hypothetical protein
LTRALSPAEAIVTNRARIFMAMVDGSVYPPRVTGVSVPGRKVTCV